jgi:Ca2+:H+ antiporter
MKSILKPSIYWLLVFVPISLWLDNTEASAPMIFFSAALSVIPIAKLIGTSTEHLASYTGDAVGGLLNATFGNLPELIIAIMALKAGLYEIVLASQAGAILGNLLLGMGLAFFVGGLKHHNQEYNPASVRVYGSMMMVAVFTLFVPSAFHRFFGAEVYAESENSLNIYLAIALLLSYVLYLVFMLKTHPEFFRSESKEDTEQEGQWSKKKALAFLVVGSVGAAFMSEVLVGAAEETGQALGMSSVFIGVIFLATVGGATGIISAVNLASKNKMDISIGISLGASIQTALFIAPVLVLSSLFIGPEQLNLSFNRALLGALFFAVFLGIILAGDGRSNWYKGVQLIVFYSILATLFYFIPVAA